MTEKHDSPEAAVPHTEAEPLPYNRLSWKLDRFIVTIGKASSWLWIGVLLVVLANVFARFILNAGSVALEEMSWHLFGAAMMLTLSFAVVRDDHVRVDVLHEKFSLKTQAVIELAGILVLALPIIYLMIDVLIPYAYKAFELNERSQAPSGLPYRFIFKSVLPLSLILVWIALFSRALRCSTLLFRFPREIQIPRDDRNGGHPHP
ncbi:TRAP transporter small permease subunit [Marinobacter sp. HL-58]|uniref:TRAP transporter small permease subunit n=1 Tax=Marinobacter sp. HL-58 TaxID=1479237 RepID=UPI000489E22D|nr:TRAP transporter small permease subunit [Marinobacter sp. HL-58]KPP96838.1 MAG: TRAP-type transport system small permease component [Marinobacter sp. HL-58]